MAGHGLIGSAFADSLSFFRVCDAHASSCDPPFRMTLRAVEGDDEDEHGLTSMTYACATDRCTFEIRATEGNTQPRRWLVDAATLSHSCGLPSRPVELKPRIASTHPSWARQADPPTPSTSKPSWFQSPTARAAPTNSSLATHWPWLSTGGPNAAPWSKAERKALPSLPLPSVTAAISPKRFFPEASTSISKPSRSTREERREGGEVEMPVLPPQIGSVWSSRDACRVAVERAGRNAVPPFTVYTARSVAAPPSRAFVVWHCQYRTKEGEGCPFLVTAKPKDADGGIWTVSSASYDHTSHPSNKPKRTAYTSSESDTGPIDFSSISATKKRKAPVSRDDRPLSKPRLAYEPPPVPEPVGPLGAFLASLHPLVGGCGPILESAGINDVELLLSLRSDELRDVMGGLKALKPFHRAVIAHRCGQVREGTRARDIPAV